MTAFNYDRFAAQSGGPQWVVRDHEAPALELSKFMVSADENAAIAALASDAKSSAFIMFSLI